MSDPNLVAFVGSDTESTLRVRPSMFNARTIANDGTLLLFNSHSGAFTGVPPKGRAEAERLLARQGGEVRIRGMAKYLLDKGFLVAEATNELHKFRSLHGHQHYRSSRMELILLASEECNFRCVYCYESFSRATMEPWVRKAVLAMAEKRIHELRSLKIGWFGGEPLLGLEAIREIAPRLRDMARENGVVYRSHMTTNGYLLSRDVFAELLDYEVRNYQITLDGISGDHNRKRPLQNGGPSFQTIYENLLAIRGIPGNFTIAIRVNFDYANLSEMPDFIGMLKQDFAEDPRFMLRFHPVEKLGGKVDQSLKICGSTSHQKLLSLNKLTNSLGVSAEPQLVTMQGQGWDICYAARPHSFVIGADGKIMKCTVALDRDERNILGRLKPDGEADLNEDQSLRWTAPAFEDDAQCKRCFYLPICQGIRCPQLRLKTGKRPCPKQKLAIVSVLKYIWECEQKGARKHTVSTV